MSEIYFVSDTHFNHKKLCSLEEVHFDRTRTYKYIDEMNKDIISQWNKIVKPEDTVIFMGDWTVGTPMAEIEKSFWDNYNQLNKKVMYWILGNHDFKIKSFIKDHFLMKYYWKLKIEDKTYVLQHKPFDEEPNQLPELNTDPTKTVLVHGHTHYDTKLSTIKFNEQNYIQNNVCWDAWYRPVHISELKTMVG